MNNSNNNPLFSLNRTNSSNVIGGFNSDKISLENNLGHNLRYSPSPSKMISNDLTHS